MDDWDILWGHMKRRVAHPLRLITFDVGDTPRHCIGDLKDDTLLSGGVCKVCELAVVARWLGQLKEQARCIRVVTSKWISVLGCTQRKNNLQLTKYRGDMGYNIPSSSVPQK